MFLPGQSNRTISYVLDPLVCGNTSSMVYNFLGRICHHLNASPNQVFLFGSILFSLFSKMYIKMRENGRWIELTFIIWLGRGPSILSIIAKCSRLSWVFDWLTDIISALESLDYTQMPLYFGQVSSDERFWSRAWNMVIPI